MSTAAVAVSGLRKAYNGLEAVRGVSFEIAEGEVFGLLGPNGAGKTTTVEILEGYRRRDAGEVSVLGADPQDAGEGWRERIGIVLQSSAMYVNLTVREHVALFAGYYAALAVALALWGTTSRPIREAPSIGEVAAVPATAPGPM